MPEEKLNYMHWRIRDYLYCVKVNNSFPLLLLFFYESSPAQHCCSVQLISGPAWKKADLQAFEEVHNQFVLIKNKVYL